MNIPKYIELYRNDLRLMNYAVNTIENYICQVQMFLSSLQVSFTEPCKINELAIKNYLLRFKTVNTLKHAQCAIKLFYKQTIKQPNKFRFIPYPKNEKKLPKIIDKEFLLKQIANIENKNGITNINFNNGKL